MMRIAKFRPLPRGHETHERISMTLGIHDDVLGIITKAALKWVVSANT